MLLAFLHKRPRDSTTLFLFHKKKTCAKRKINKLVLLVKRFFKPLQGLRGCGAEPNIRKRFLVKICVILWLQKEQNKVKSFVLKEIRTC
jgi:hypothetical protein